MTDAGSLSELTGEEAEDAPPVAWQPRPWWAWALSLLTLGAGATLLGGTLLAGAEFGTALRARDCDSSPLAGLGMLAAAGLALGLALQAIRLRWHGAVLVWDAGSLLLSLPIPLALLAATLPAVLGCPAGARIADMALIGSALVGPAGIALAAAASALVGVALAGCAHVGWVSAHGGAGEHQPGIVELAMAEAEALEADSTAGRFHGIDSRE